MSGELKNILEAVLLAAEAPLSVARLRNLFPADAQPSDADIKTALRELQQDCETRGVELRKIGAGYRYHSRPQYAEWIAKLHAVRPPKLSRALLETLAIIAYRQPVTRGDIESIRGVGVSGDIIRRLLEREWICEAGVREAPGHPTLFATTAEFLSYFNLAALGDLPRLQEERDLREVAADMNINLPAETADADAAEDAHKDSAPDNAAAPPARDAS